MLGLIAIEFGLFCLCLFFIALKLWRIEMTQEEVLAKVAQLETKVRAALAKLANPPAPDLSAIGSAVDAISAEVDAANPPA